MSKLDGMASRNEEQANEAWRAQVTAQLAVLRLAAQRIEDVMWAARDPRPVFLAAGEDISEAEQAIFNLRHGPEAPE